MISLAYYLRVVAAIWMRPAAEPLAPEAPAVPAMAGGSPEADAAGVTLAADAAPKGTRCLAMLVPAGLLSAATIFFGIIPSPLVDWASHAGAALAPFLS